MPPAQLQALLDLDFELPPASGPLKLQGEIDVKVGVDGTEAGARRDGTKARVESADSPSVKQQKRNVTIGEVIPLTPDMAYQLEMLLESRMWPKSQRENISGFGITLGVETHSGIPRLSPSIDREIEPLRVPNQWALGHSTRCSTVSLEHNTS